MNSVPKLSAIDSTCSDAESNGFIQPQLNKCGGLRRHGLSKQHQVDKPLVSVITVVFNGVATLECTILSVQQQTYDNIEHIIIDGGSTDGTMDILLKYDGFLDYWVSEKDAGIYDAMNKGIALASGTYVGLLNSDDFFSSSDAVRHIVEALQANHTDAIYSCLNIVDRKNSRNILRKYRTSIFWPNLMRIGIVPPHPTLYCTKAVYDKVGKYKTDYRVSADFEMMVRMFIISKITWQFLDETTVNMRAGGVSNNGLAGQVHQNLEIVRACRENGVYTNIFMIALKLPIKLIQTLVARLSSRKNE